ncbi:MAG: enoyl-CoA hydratase/isomerase family protein [Bacillota bacterium]|nr:enoyl-CoA hydratase/isomerase family protein [Bacillota bacterium]
MRSEALRLEIAPLPGGEGRVAWLTVDRAERRNAMTRSMWEELAGFLEEVERSPGVRALVLRGRPGSFCAGADLDELRSLAPPEVDAAFALMEATLEKVERLGAPTLAVADGVAAGAGLELLLACDLRLGTPRARLGMPVARLGILPGVPFAARLVRAIGPARAKELLLTGRLLPADEALAWGLLSRLVPEEELEAALASLLGELARLSPASLRAAKRAVSASAALASAGGEASPPQEEARAATIDPGSFYEAVRAWAEGRDPLFGVTVDSRP